MLLVRIVRVNGTTWTTQRGELHEMVEDMGNQDQITYYASYLLNAGATVVPMRPLGHQAREVIVDNADAGFTVMSGAWTDGAFAPYWSNSNGNGVRYRSTDATATETAVARFTPNLAAAGFYPVYAWALSGGNRVPDQGPHKR